MNVGELKTALAGVNDDVELSFHVAGIDDYLDIGDATLEDGEFVLWQEEEIEE